MGPENRAKTAHLADLAMSDNESSNHDELEFDQSDSPPQEYPSPFDTLHDSGITYRPQSTPDIVVNDSTPLLYHSNDSFISTNKQSTGFIFKATMHKFFLDFTSLLPATFLGLMLNVIDGVSYGLIAFPPGKTFSGFGGDGVSMYMITCIDRKSVV